MTLKPDFVLKLVDCNGDEVITYIPLFDETPSQYFGRVIIGNIKKI